MAQGKNTFGKLMNQDNSRSKYSPENYYYLLNGKVITQTGLSSESITNVKGNTLSFQIPDTAPVYEILVPENYTGTSQLTFNCSSVFTVPLLTDTVEEIYTELLNDSSVQSSISNEDFQVFLNSGRIVIVGLDDLSSVTLGSGNLTFEEKVPALTGLKICGWENLENKIIICTTDSDDDAPEDEAGQIWEVEYDESTGEIIDLSNGLLVPSKHLKYNNLLNFSTSNRVGEIIGRYENVNIRNIYFTDNYNLLRTFNLADPNGLALNPQDLDARADLNLSTPIYKSIGSGSIPIGSTVQYGYRLKTSGGNTSNISPLSPPLSLSLDPNTGDYEDFKGSAYNASNSRSVTYIIKDIDTSYELIEHIAVVFTTLDSPEIYIFKEELVPANGELTVTHTGSEDETQLTSVELNALVHPFICKTITSKRNKLIAANLKYKKVKIDFDARAFRFSSSPLQADLYDKQGNIDLTITSANLNTITIADTLDCINPYNDESGTIFGTVTGNPTTWESSYQYKYQIDGTTLGGTGKNVSYQFVDTAVRAFNNSVTGTPPHTSVSRATVDTISIPNGETVSNTGLFTDFKSPLKSAYLKGYKRGEVYRFGIVFYDKKGTPSMVNWIGDIRFPEVNEFNLGSGSVNSLDTNQLGIEFTVDISSIQTEISGFSIVRLERQEKDKTRLGTGCYVGLDNSVSGSRSLSGLFDNAALSEKIEIASSQEIDVYYIEDNPGIGDPNQFQALFGFLFPKHQYGNLEFKDGDFLKEIGDYTCSPICTYYDNTGDNTIGVFYRGYQYNALSAYNRFLIDEFKTLDYLGYFDANEFTALSTDINTIVNTSYSRAGGILVADRYTPLGLGNKKMIVQLNAPTAGFDNNIKGNWAAGQFGGGTTAPTEGASIGSGAFNIKPLDYCRFLTTQYGGSSYESRASQTYISTGHFQYVDNTSSTSQVATVYGGDIFTQYYSDEYITMHWEASGNSGDFLPEKTNNKLSCAVGLPVETEINLAYRHGNTYSDDQDFSGTWTKTPYTYNNVYSQNANVIQQFISPSILDRSTEEHPHQIVASQEKIDGELFNAWRVFSPNDLIEVDGNHGEINKIITYRDKVFFFQTRAVGVVSVQDRSITQDVTGAEVILGTGQVLDFYQYLSTTSGCFHQFSVIAGGNGLYYIDTLSRKAMLISEGVQPISTIEGLSAYFDTLLDGLIQTVDKTINYNTVLPTSSTARVGIHGVFDKRNHCIIWTFLKGEERLGASIFGEDVDGYVWRDDNSTIVYNELKQGFEEFLSHTPSLWLDNQRRLLSVDPSTQDEIYVENNGDRGEFYGTSYPTKITIVINSAPDLVKTLDNIEFLLDLKTSAGADIPLETFDTIRVYNSYQDTGALTLIPQQNITRQFRKWRMNVLRDTENNNPRLRDYHFFLELTYNNNNNKELILHDITHNIRSSNF